MTEQHDLVARLRELDPWDMPSLCEEAMHNSASRIEALESRQRVLREALEPFAKEAVLWSDAYDPPPENEPMWIGCRKNRFMTDEVAFTLGDLRRARRALAGDAG